MNKWYEKSSKNGDVVVSSRIRLARNLANYRFADRISSEEAVKLIESVSETVNKKYDGEFNCILMKDCTENKKKALKEKRQISNALVNRKDSAVLMSADESVSLMLNAEDLIRIQVLSNGMNIAEAFRKANELDDFLDSEFDYAFDEKYGYKTTYPTNVGTGLRAGYTLHLPGLASAKRISKIATELGRFGVKMKAVYGDDIGYGDLYQVATQKTLGQTEQEIINDLNDIVMQIIKQEREQRSFFYEKDRVKLEDGIYRSYGVLKYARKLALRDALTLLSEIMLGDSLGIITMEPETKFYINKIIMDIQPAVINNTSHRAMSVEEADIIRAQYIRNNCPEII